MTVTYGNAAIDVLNSGFVVPGPAPHDLVSAAFVAALGELSDITKDREANAGSYKYKYADLASALSMVRAVFKTHDLALYQTVAYNDTQVHVTTTALHASGQTLNGGTLSMPARGGAQDIGSALTYARRYALMAFCGLATEDDDGARATQAHGEAASGPPAGPKAIRRPKTPRDPDSTPSDRFRQACAGEGLSDDDMRTLVTVSTGGRTDNPDDVTDAEWPKLRAEFRAATAGPTVTEPTS